VITALNFFGSGGRTTTAGLLAGLVAGCVAGRVAG
jgi:hypothetical protein